MKRKLEVKAYVKQRKHTQLSLSLSLSLSLTLSSFSSSELAVRRALSLSLYSPPPPGFSLERQTFLTQFYSVNVTYLYTFYIHIYGKFTQLSHESMKNAVLFIVQAIWVILSTWVSVLCVCALLRLETFFPKIFIFIFTCNFTT